MGRNLINKFLQFLNPKATLDNDIICQETLDPPWNFEIKY